MKNNIIKFLLLFTLSFNIAHASIIAVLDDCEDCHNNVLYEYISEADTVSDSTDLCTMHHFFHFTAIVLPAVEFLEVSFLSEKPLLTHLDYQSAFTKTFYRPPIA